LAEFKTGSIPVLVATDIAARGLDIDQLPQVVNFELPNVPEDYVHRIGRTGRAGSSGAAISLVDEEETKFLKDIEKLIKREIPKVNVEGFVPPAKLEPEPPRLFRGQQPNRSGMPKQGQPKHNQNRPSQSAQAQKQVQGRNSKDNKQSNNKPTSVFGHGKLISPAPQKGKPLSEAARHQAQPQPPLFNPKPPKHRSGGRGR
jgi:ATP-dependent RNA helicase RhlE